MVSHAPSYRVVEAIAQQEGVSPTELTPPLFSVIDPEALDALINPTGESKNGGVEIEFTYLDYVVRVRDGLSVSVSVQHGDETVATSDSVQEQRASFEE